MRPGLPPSACTTMRNKRDKALPACRVYNKRPDKADR